MWFFWKIHKKFPKKTRNMKRKYFNFFCIILPQKREVIVGVVIFFFNFLMLLHWLASHEGFNIKWQHEFRPCLNSLKNSLKNGIKLKSKFKYLEKFQKFGGNLANFFPEKKGNIVTDIFSNLFWFAGFWRNFAPQKKRCLGAVPNCLFLGSCRNLKICPSHLVSCNP